MPKRSDLKGVGWGKYGVYPRVRGEGKRWRKIRPDERRDAMARDARCFACVCAVVVSVAYLLGTLGVL